MYAVSVLRVNLMPKGNSSKAASPHHLALGLSCTPGASLAFPWALPLPFLVSRMKEMNRDLDNASWGVCRNCRNMARAFVRSRGALASIM